MSKNLVLLDDVEGLGIVGEVVKVTDGYARNFLLPKRLATPVTEAARKRLEVKRAAREAELASQFEGAQALAVRIEETTLSIPAKTVGDKKLYGAIGPVEVIKAAKDASIALEKSQVHMGAHFKELGSYEVKIKLHPKVKATLKVNVVEDKS
jgi:large subunit ribosomal protein L9